MRGMLEFFLGIVQTTTLFVFYTRISGIILKWYRYFLLAVLFYFFSLLMTLIFSNNIFSFISYLLLPTFFLIFSLLISKEFPTYLSLFYGLFPVVLWNILYRIITFFILPIFQGIFVKQIDYNIVLLLSALISSLISLRIPKLLRYDFKQLQDYHLNQADKKLIVLLNISMLLYYGIVQIIFYIERLYRLDVSMLRELVVVVYIILFLLSVNILDRNLRERIQYELSHQKEIQLQNMADYSQHIEDLYNELRGFRHDYINILRSLRLGIENKDLPAIERVYNEVLEGTGEPLNQSKYDLGRLYNINNDALKSLLSAKFLEAQNKKIMAGIEVPQPIEPQGMELLDILTVLSILIDNAIEAAVAARKATLSIAYIQQEGEQIFIVENSTQENVVDTSKIFERGISSKGKNRGIGLSNVQKIISRYPNVSLRTISHDYHFRQELEIKLSGNK